MVVGSRKRARKVEQRGRRHTIRQRQCDGQGGRDGPQTPKSAITVKLIVLSLHNGSDGRLASSGGLVVRYRG